MKRLFALLVLCCAASFSQAATTTACDGAGNCYVRAGATGSANGSSWTDAYTGFGTGAGKINPSSMTRGYTYWVAAGSYGSPNFNTTDSGTTVITVTAATPSTHGPATDWSASYGGQVTFGADTEIGSDYWIFDGQSWPTSCTGVAACGTTGYNLYFHNSTDGTTSGAALIIPGSSNISLKYVEVQGVSNGTSDDGGIEIQCPTNNFYLGHSYVHDVGVDLIQGQYTCSGQNYTGTGHTYEYDYFSHNHRGDASAHAQAIATGAQNLTVRYSVFHDITSSGCITDPFPGVVNLANWAVYGNTFEWDNSEAAGVGNGLIGLYGEVFTGYLNVYNNTIANINNPACQSGVCNSPAVFVCGTNCGSSGSVNAQVYNNLWWNPSYAIPVMYDGSSSWSATVDYNQAYCPSGGCSYAGSFSKQGSHDVFSTTGNPFSNFDGTSNFKIQLVADTSAGSNLSSSLPSGCIAAESCYNVDPMGIIRAADGIWDRGAMQISGSAASAPNPPTNLSAAVQ